MRIYILDNMPPTVAPFVEQVFELDTFPHTRALMTSLTAEAIRKSPAALLDQTALDPATPEGLIQSFLLHGLDAKETIHLPRHLHERLVERRCALLSLLADTSHFSPAARISRAIEFFIRNVDVLCGLELLMHSGLYQFNAERPWWRDGRFFASNEEVIETLLAKGDLRTLHKYDFVQVSQQQYRQRLRPNLLSQLFSQGQGLELAAIIHFYTGALNEACDHRRHVAKLVSKLIETLPSQDGGYASIPMFPLYSLPRETRNVYRLSVSSFEDDEDDKRGRVLRAGSGRAKLHPDTEELLIFDRSLVFKKSGHADQFMSVELDNPEHSVLRALVSAIEKLELQPDVMEHVPRIVAGIFQAAWRDKNKPFTHAGAFWETESGRRLCDLVGFDADNQRHRARVQQALFILSNLVLHREIVYPGRKKKKLQWSGPIIQKLKDRIEVREEDREGVSSQQVFQEWLVAVELWELVQPSDPDHSPLFMLIDRRAFRLDASDSNPFNFYWTLINRAYMDRSVNADGSYTSPLSVLLDWSGIEHDSKRTKGTRLKSYLMDILARFVQSGLITQWRCDELAKDAPSTLAAIRNARLTVWFDKEQLSHFPDYIFTGSKVTKHKYNK
jgi:hypothetical protein